MRAMDSHVPLPSHTVAGEWFLERPLHRTCDDDGYVSASTRVFTLATLRSIPLVMSSLAA